MDDSAKTVRVDPTPFAQVPEQLVYSTLTDKAVRLWIALVRHGEDPSSCFPSERRLAGLIGCAPRSVQRPLRELEDAGWITRVTRLDAGRQTTNGYHVHRAPMTTSDAPPAQESAPPPRAPERGEKGNESQEGTRPRKHLSTDVDVRDEQFERFWSLWRDGTDGRGTKVEARKAWTAMLRKKPPVDLRDVRAGLDAWVTYWREAGTEGQFIPHASTWLRNERWTAAPPKVESGSKQSALDFLLDDDPPDRAIGGAP